MPLSISGAGISMTGSLAIRQPADTRYSVSFNGSTSSLQTVASASSSLIFGTGDFTIEFWVYATASTRPKTG